MEKKILILASNGFLGSNIKKYFEKEKVYCLNRKIVDFRDKELLNGYFKEIQPDIVINCAGIVGSSEKNKGSNDYDVLNENILLNINILDCCKDSNVKKIFMFSTYRLFGDEIRDNYDETDIQKNENIKYNEGYLTSKKIMDIQIKLFVKNYNIDVTCLILTNIFGLNDEYSLNARIVPSLIKKMKIAIIEKTNVVINSNKDTLINLVYVTDICKLIENCILNNIVGNVLVFNKNGIITLEKLVFYLKNILNYNYDIFFNNEKQLFDSFIMNPNLQKFESFFPNFEFSDINESLKYTIENTIFS